MAVGETVLREMLAQADLAESVSYVPDSGGSAVSLTAKIQRQEPRIDEIPGRGRFLVYEALVAVLTEVDESFGGVVAPEPGDNWTIAKYHGGTGQSGWMAGVASGRGGVWRIPVRLQEDLEAGGSDPDQ